jgi:hypothetical protein
LKISENREKTHQGNVPQTRREGDNPDNCPSPIRKIFEKKLYFCPKPQLLVDFGQNFEVGKKSQVAVDFGLWVLSPSSFRKSQLRA